MSHDYEGKHSNCCNALIIFNDICSLWGDHTEPIENEPDTCIQEFCDSIDNVSDGFDEIIRLENCHSTEL